MCTQRPANGISVQWLEGMQDHNVPQEKRNEGWKNCALHAKNRLQSEVLYYDDNAVLTMQCDAQRYF